MSDSLFSAEANHRCGNTGKKPVANKSPVWKIPLVANINQVFQMNTKH